MRSNITIKNVSWPHYIWPTLYVKPQITLCGPAQLIADWHLAPQNASFYGSYGHCCEGEARLAPRWTATALDVSAAPCRQVFQQFVHHVYVVYSGTDWAITDGG